MGSFNESFYTEEFDQEMLDFIDNRYNVYNKMLWCSGELYLRYSSRSDNFWTNDTLHTDGTYLTKDEIKRKIGMPTEETIMENETVQEQATFGKKDLLDGMFVKFSNGEYRLVLSGNLQGSEGFWSLDSFTEDLLFLTVEGDERDVVEVLTCDGSHILKTSLERGYGLTSIWKRTPPKSEKVIKLEKLISMHEEQLEATKKLLEEELSL